MEVKRPEILAPCGNISAFNAAIAAGADACYLAGNSFGARAYAENFDRESLIETIGKAHLHGVRVYLTANTLVKNNEIESLYDSIGPLYEAGLDAVLVQDFGVFRIIREYFPDLPVHTSTQMNITTVAGAEMVKRLGAERVVAAREMTLEEMRRIKEEVGIEVEAFVHGAMCFCYSGRCLMSSMAGGRSGNRGSCAQPCRKKYDGTYKLSMRDMCTLEYIPELVCAGIDSLKIEGRMKNEYYVAATVDAYRQITEDYIQGVFSYEKVDAIVRKLLDTFNRGGFTTGYLMMDRNDKDRREKLIDESMPGRRGVFAGSIKNIKNGKISFDAAVNIGAGDEFLVDTFPPISITSGASFDKGDEALMACPETKRIRKKTCIYRTRNLALQKQLDELIGSKRYSSVYGQFVLKQGQNASFTLSLVDRPEVSVTVMGSVVSAAKQKTVTNDVIMDKLSRMKDSPFSLRELDIDNDNESFIPMSELNNLRRDTVQKLENRIRSLYERDASKVRPFSEENSVNINEDKYEDKFAPKTFDDFIHVSVSDMNQLKALDSMKMLSDISFLYFDMGLGRISELDIESMTEDIKSRFPELKLILALPYINRGEYSVGKFSGLIEKCDGVYVRCIDDLAGLSMLQDFSNKIVILASSIYAYNDFAVREILDILKKSKCKVIFEAPIELSSEDCSDIFYPQGTEVVRDIYGRLPIMITDALGDYEDIIRDDKGYGFIIRRAGQLCYNVILSENPLSLHQYETEIGSRKYSFTTENEKEIRDVFSASPEYIKNGHFTKGHYRKGI